jgi:hypothetical protein
MSTVSRPDPVPQPQQPQHRPFVIGERVRCPHDDGMIVIAVSEDAGRASVVFPYPVVRGTGGSWAHTHPVDELRHGMYVTRWVDDR